MKKLFFIILFSLLGFICNAQSGNFLVRGTVYFEGGGKAVGVTVREVGTTNATLTDMDGKYEIYVSSGYASLEYSLIGYWTEVEDVDLRHEIDVYLTEDIFIRSSSFYPSTILKTSYPAKK